MTATITTNAPEWSAQFNKWAALAGKDVATAFKQQGRLLCQELISRTPPFSGKVLGRMLSARGINPAIMDEQIATATARKVGMMRVEKDIRRIIYGVRGGAYVGDKNDPNVQDFGALQRCEGKRAVRIFAKKDGTVYGTDINNFKPDASLEELKAHHTKNRGKRGRVTTAGQKSRTIGRWKWLEVIVTKESIVKKFIAATQKHVGEGKGGWVAGLRTFGGKAPQWIASHAKSGSCRAIMEPWHCQAEIVNGSKWASGGDDERIIQKSMEGRARAMAADCERMIKERWGSAMAA